MWDITSPHGAPTPRRPTGAWRQVGNEAAPCSAPCLPLGDAKDGAEQLQAAQSHLLRPHLRPHHRSFMCTPATVWCCVTQRIKGKAVRIGDRKTHRLLQPHPRRNDQAKGSAAQHQWWPLHRWQRKPSSTRSDGWYHLQCEGMQGASCRVGGSSTAIAAGTCAEARAAATGTTVNPGDWTSLSNSKQYVSKADAQRERQWMLQACICVHPHSLVASPSADATSCGALKEPMNSRGIPPLLAMLVL